MELANVIKRLNEAMGSLGTVAGAASFAQLVQHSASQPLLASLLIPLLSLSAGHHALKWLEGRDQEPMPKALEDSIEAEARDESLLLGRTRRRAEEVGLPEALEEALRDRETGLLMLNRLTRLIQEVEPQGELGKEFLDVQQVLDLQQGFRKALPATNRYASVTQEVQPSRSASTQIHNDGEIGTIVTVGDVHAETVNF